jgi:hypothetical protein
MEICDPVTIFANENENKNKNKNFKLVLKQHENHSCHLNAQAGGP